MEYNWNSYTNSVARYDQSPLPRCQLNGYENRTVQALHWDFASGVTLATASLAANHTDAAGWQLFVDYQSQQQTTDQIYAVGYSILPSERATRSGVASKTRVKRPLKN